MRVVFAGMERYRERANKVLFMDTDAITTMIFSQHYYQRCPR
jgi:nicotinamide riboside kinase